MGGIKNKLSKLTSRVKTLFNNAANNLGSSARGAVERSETEGVNDPPVRLSSDIPPLAKGGLNQASPWLRGGR